MDFFHVLCLLVICIFSLCHSYWLFYVSLNVCVLAYFAWTYCESEEHSKYWEWDNGAETSRYRLNTDHIRFPKNFLWGVATSSYQVEGGSTNSQWAQWEQQKKKDGTSTIKNGHTCDQAVDHWNRVTEDIQLMKDIGVNSYRFSLAWDKIEPSPSEFNESAVQHYHDELDELLANGITPMITLHHFAHPIWFEKLGAFENEQNISYFESFCVRMFSEFAPKCKYWCTINEPEIFSSMTYLYEKFPPAKFDAAKYSKVMLNLMKAHVQVYFALKSHRLYDPSIQIGIAKNIFQFDAYYPLDPIALFCGSRLNEMCNLSILNFFANGEFHLKHLPVIGNSSHSIHYIDKRAPQTLDFLGLNYYSHVELRANWSFPLPVIAVHRQGTMMTDMPFGVYPEGMYRALMTCARIVKKPILITETGISDSKDQFRNVFLRRYLYAVSRAIADGADVRGIFYWSLVSNFEWCDGWTQKFGLYEVPDRKTQKRVLYKGARYLSHVIAKSTGKKNKIVEEDEKDGLVVFPSS